MSRLDWLMTGAGERREDKPGAFELGLKEKEQMELVKVVVRHKARRDRISKIEPGKWIRPGR